MYEFCVLGISVGAPGLPDRVRSEAESQCRGAVDSDSLHPPCTNLASAARPRRPGCILNVLKQDEAAHAFPMGMCALDLENDARARRSRSLSARSALPPPQPQFAHQHVIMPSQDPISMKWVYHHMQHRKHDDPPFARGCVGGNLTAGNTGQHQVRCSIACFMLSLPCSVTNPL